VQNLAVFKTLLNFEPPAFENAASDDSPMFSPSLMQLGSRTPEKALSVVTHPLKIARENVLNRQ